MDEKYIFLKGYTDRLLEKGKCFSDIGLWNGKMGIAIYLFHMSRITNCEEYENLASMLIEEVFEKISYEIPFSYADGLLGVGCGVEYLIMNGFVNGDGDDVLIELDKLVQYNIDSRPFNTLSLANGVCGIGYYLYFRLANKVEDNDSPITLKNKEILIYLIDWMEELLLKSSNEQEINDSYFLLCRLHQLNVINFKVDKMLCHCLQKIGNFNFSLQDNYERLGINSLKLLKQWM